jgi:glyoxylase-like metal-dependent hydrolase (beta-lactamase superfamily II)
LLGNESLRPETPARVAPGVVRIVAGNAGMMTGPGTNTYLIGDRERVVIDPGPDDDRHLEAILEEAGDGNRWIITTHTHRDHSPLTARLKLKTGAMVIGRAPPRDGRQDDTYAADREPADGERLRLGEFELISIHTPGHASNCVCYLYRPASLLFTGDHVLEGVSPVILPPDGDMGQYFQSLDRLMRYDFESIAPGHGRVMAQGKRVIGALKAHRQAREDKVLAALAGLKQATLDELVPPVYDDVPKDRHDWARLTLEAHLIKLQRERKVEFESGVYRPTRA